MGEVKIMVIRKRKGAILGFDAVFFLLVIVIFVSLGAYGFTQYLDNAKRATAKNQIATIVAAISHYHYDMDKYPEKLENLKDTSGTLGPWIADIPTDPWKKPYEYVINSNKNGFVVYSTCGSGATVDADTKPKDGDTTAVYAYGK